MRTLNQTEAAEALGLSRRTIANWIRAGHEVPCDHKGRLRFFDAEELAEWAASKGLGIVGGDRQLQRFGGDARSPEAREEIRQLKRERQAAAFRRELAEAETAEAALAVAQGRLVNAEEEAERWSRCRAEAEAELIGALPDILVALDGQGEEEIRERLIREWVYARLTALSEG